MKIEFSKYHGTGNDFILIDNRNSSFTYDEKLIARLCDRRFGIGADGLLLLHNISDYDFEMLYFNSDGGLGSMCGNGGRCIVAFAEKLCLIKDNKTSFYAYDEAHTAEILEKNTNDTIVKLSMNNVKDIDTNNGDYILDSGSPHFVRFVENVKEFDVVEEGKKIRYNEHYKHNGINVDFVQISKNILPTTNSELLTDIFVRTYERGVEDETLSCGTGVVASSIAYLLKTNQDSPYVNVKTLGGNLKVFLKRSHSTFEDIFLQGPATFVYSGHIEV